MLSEGPAAPAGGLSGSKDCQYQCPRKSQGPPVRVARRTTVDRRGLAENPSRL
jgi:hypothetical protein